MNSEKRPGGGLNTLNLIAASALVGTLTVAVPGVRDVFRFGENEPNPDEGTTLANSSLSAEPTPGETVPVEPSPSPTPSITELPTLTPSVPTATETIAPTPVDLASDTVTPTEILPPEPVSDEFTVGAFNMLYSTVPTQWADRWPYRLGLSVRLIRKYMDVGALQEIRPEVLQAMQREKLEATNTQGERKEYEMLGDDFDIFPKADIGYGSQNPVVWRTSEFEFIDGKLIDGARVTKPGVHDTAATQVRLRHIPTGRTVFVISEHAPVGADRAEPRHTNAEARANDLRQLQLDHPDALIIYGGDLNSYYNAAPGDPQPTVGNNPQNTAYCLVTNVGGLIDALDAFEHRDEESLPQKCNPRDVHRVDHLFFSNRKWIKVKGYQYGGGENGELNAPVNGSDVHATLLSNIRVDAPAPQ